MKRELEKQIGIELPENFIHILTAFNKKFGGREDGIDEFLNYLNSSYLVSVEEARDYENTPIEISPFIGTGGDGTYYGYLILAPELESKDFPIVSYTQAGGYLDFWGNSTLEAIEQIISNGHSENNFEQIDLPFLDSVGIYPSSSKSDNGYYNFNYDTNSIIIPPLQIPDNYSYVMTHDGIGVLARLDLFNKTHKELNNGNNVNEFIKEAWVNMNKGYWASALFHLKEAWFYKYYIETAETKRQLRDMLMKVYEALDRKSYADRLRKEFDWL